MDKTISEYIHKQHSPQKEILEKVRKIFLKAIPGCDEAMNWGAITFAGKKFYLAALNQRVHIGFTIHGLTNEEMSQFEGSGKTMRHIKIRILQDIDENKLTKLIKLVNKKAVCTPC